MRKTYRRRAALVLLVGAVIIAAVILAIMAWLDEDAEPQPSQLATATPAPDALFFRVVQDESQLAVAVDSTLGTIDGGYEMGPGTVELVRGADGWTVIVNLTFDARTLDIGNEQVNAIMRRALEVETYPNGIFIARSRDPLPHLDTAQQADLVGQLELHGEVVDYTIPTTITRDAITRDGNTHDEDILTLNAEIVIDASEFGVSIPGWIASSDLDADLRVVAQREAPEAAP